MNFTNLSQGHTCQCHKGASENCADTFARKVGEAKGLKARDFRTHSERGIIPESNECDELCGYKGLSINIWTEQSKSYVYDKFSLTLGISPKLKTPRTQIGVFKILEEAGKVKHTPEQKEGIDVYHYDFYKSDEFDIDKLVLVEMISFV